MKKKSLILFAIGSIILLTVVGVTLIIITPKIKKQEVAQNVETEQNEEENEVIVATIGKKHEEIEEDPLYVKTAADITQEIQEQDINIGTLNIPKINFNSEVYCRQNPDKMEVMPCMLYTNLGPNKPGVTVLIGHNRENGTLFSNINKLEENDELYFTDLDGDEKKYKVYSKFDTSNDDVSFYNTPSQSPIIVMQCCLTRNSSNRVTIVMAQAVE